MAKNEVKAYFQEKTRYIKNFKKVILLCIHGATKRFEKGLINEQEVLNNIAEMMMETYVSESLALRVKRLAQLRSDKRLYKDMLDVNLFDAANIVRKSALEAISTFCTPESCPALTGL